jgi:hypothetical protein
MGYGKYSATTASLNATVRGYATRSTFDIFQEKSINNAMSPYGVKVRESRDSADNPNTYPFIIALDETGSMGSVPHYLCKQGLTDTMDKVMKGGQPDPQVLFLGIGDHECDRSPLQVGQFESSDELLDKWLTTVYLEGNGGGNGGESYLLAWYFAAKHTVTDSWEKRKKKGLLLTVGDEPTLNEVPGNTLKNLMGPGEYKTYTKHELLELARQTYDVYHIHVMETASGSRRDVQNGWKELMGDNVVFANKKEDISTIIADLVLKHSLEGATTPQKVEKEDDPIL